MKYDQIRMKTAAILMIAVFCVLAFAGCAKEDQSSGGSSSSSVEKWKEDVTVTWWLMGGTEEYAQTYWSEMKGLQRLQDNIGIHIDFKVATSYDAYLPMMAARNYPDVVTASNLQFYPGRLDGMFHDGVSVDLTPYMDEYMPNFKQIIEDYPDLAKDIRLDSGEYTFVSTFYDIHNEADRVLASTAGLAIRQDWLDTVGREIPTDMQEWYEVLSLFKSADPNGNGQQDEEPICMASSCWKYFLTAYGIDDDPSVQFDQDDNPVVVYGYMTDAYKEFLAEMNRWYQEGLIYNMFEKTSLEAMSQQVNSNLAGAWKGNVAHFDETDEDSMIRTLREKAPDAEFAACPWPETADGYQWNFSEITSFATETTVITSAAVDHDVDEAAAYLLDYMLSEEGSTLLTWGIEGESYEEVNGEKKLLDSMQETISFHGKNIQKINQYSDPITIKLPNFGQVSEFVLANQNQSYIDASTTWSKGDISYKMQAACQLNVEQKLEADTIEDTMKNYITKMRQRFITGLEPLTNYDTYIEQVKLLGGDQYVEIWQRAYDGWRNR